MPENIVVMKNICKDFGLLRANDHIDFYLKKGSIHGLLGENGAGKTTLMNILYGFYSPDAGEIFIRDEEVEIKSPKVAMGLGMGMVHQHFMQIRTLTVVENVVLGHASDGIWIDVKTAIEHLNELSNKYNFQVDPMSLIRQLSVGQQQRVEILTALYKGADILILDEPTAVLTPQEVEEFFHILDIMREDGKSIILISHKLDEIIGVTDECTVLRDGKVVDNVQTAHTSPEELAYKMVGRDIIFDFTSRKSCEQDKILKLDNVKAMNDRGLLSVDINYLDICKGEILGLAGVDGNGQTELCEVMTGLRPIAQGKVCVNGSDLTNKKPVDFIEGGVAYIPEDRHHTGLAMNFSITVNLFLKTFKQKEYCGRLLLNFKRMKNDAQEYIKAYKIKTGNIDMPISSLSGGNQQKVILARELGNKPILVVAQQPTRGLDISATEYVRNRLLEERERGAAVFLVSTDLEEIWQLSDRIAVIYKGKIMGIVSRSDVTIETIGLMMAGSQKGETNNAAIV